MICSLSLKKGTNITGFVVEDIIGEFAMQTNQIIVTSLNGYHNCILLDITMSKNNHSLTYKTHIV